MCLAVPGKIIEIDNSDKMMIQGKVDFAGIIKDISLAFVPEAKIGDYVIVHAGFAINIINKREALKVFEYLSQE